MTSPDARAPGVLRVGRLLGVPVELAPTWFVFAAVVVVAYGPQLARGASAGRGYGTAAVFAVLLLVSVLLHEAGHCVAARLLRLRVRRVRVSFLAGVTEVVDAPSTPGRAYAVSISGPLVSVLLTGLGLVLVAALPASGAVRDLAVLFALSNGGLAVFNLLPGLPLDGGAVLRAVVWKLSGDAATGTLVAAQAGRALAVLVVPGLLLGLPLLGLRVGLPGLVTGALVAVFLYVGATGALGAARAERRLRGVRLDALSRPALLVPSGTPLSAVLSAAHDAALHAVVVTDATGRPTAVVSEAAVQAVPPHRRAWVSVDDLARPLDPGLLLDPRLAGEQLLAAVRATPATEYVVRTAPPRVLAAADLARAAGAPAPEPVPAGRSAVA